MGQTLLLGLNQIPVSSLQNVFNSTHLTCESFVFGTIDFSLFFDNPPLSFGARLTAAEHELAFFSFFSATRISIVYFLVAQSQKYTQMHLVWMKRQRSLITSRLSVHFISILVWKSWSIFLLINPSMILQLIQRSHRMKRAYSVSSETSQPNSIPKHFAAHK